MPGKNGNGKNGNGKKNGGKKGNGDSKTGGGEDNGSNGERSNLKPSLGIGLEDYIRIFQVNIISSENSKTHRKDQGAPKIQALAKPA